MGPMTSSVRRNDAQHRSLVMLAVLLVTATLLAYTAALPAGVRAEHSEGTGPLDHFTVELTGPATAGVAIDVTVTARDHDGQIVADYAGGATFEETLGSSTGGCDGPCAPVFGALAFELGIAETTVTPYLAEIGVILTVADGSATGSSDPFDVVAGALATLDVDPDTATIEAGTTQTYSAAGADAYGNSLGDVTSGTSFDVDGSACAGADCGSESANDYTVTGTNGSITDGVSLTVEPGPLATIELDPGESTLSADAVPETYLVEGFDQYGNSRGDVTGDTTFDITPGGACVANACGSTTVGTYTVTGDAGGSITDTADLTVTPGALASFTFEAIDDQIAGTAFDVTVTAYDAHGNIKTDYAGGAALSGLAASPGCADCAPAIASTSTTYGTLTFEDGVATTSVSAFAATASATLTVTDGDVSDDSASFAVDHSAVLGGITIDAIGLQVAGTSFGVTVRAFDEFGNAKLDQAGGSLSGLADSPGCGGCQPPLAVAQPDHGTLSWSSGDGTATASVTAVNAEDLASLGATVDTASNISNEFTVGPGPLGGFVIDAIDSPQVAGVAFVVTATAYDLYGNVKTDYAGGDSLTHTLASSPFGDDPLAPASMTWGSGTGTGSASVTAFKAELLASQAVTITDGTVAATSNAFGVNPAGVDSLRFSIADPGDPDDGFAGQPLDSEIGTPIYSVCAPPPAVPDPCSLAAGDSVGVRVLVRDAFGNPVLDGTTVTLGTNPSSSGLGSATTDAGVADFDDQPVISSLGNFRLKAASGSASVLSEQRTIVSDLAACDEQDCENLADNGGGTKLQRAFGLIRTGGDFYDPGQSNVLLTTTFDAVLGGDFQCGSSVIGDWTTLEVQGGGIVQTAPDTDMLLVIPKDTLKEFRITNRGTSNFSVCLGAKWIGSGDPTAWTAQGGKKGPGVASQLRSDGRYWGTPADCGTAYLSPTDPCVALRTKQAADIQAYFGMSAAEVAAIMNDADLAIIIRKDFPWDGKGAIY